MKYLVIIVSILTLLSCDCYHSRECSGFNYDTSKWIDINEKDTLKFITSDGRRLTFELKEQFYSQPYVDSALGPCKENDPARVYCSMTSVFSFESEEGINLEMLFLQDDQFDKPEEEEAIHFTLRYKNTSTLELFNLVTYQIEPVYNNQFNKFQVADSMIINDIVYYDLIIQDVNVNTPLEAFPENFAITKVIASRGKGIVYMIDKDGLEYFLHE